VEAHRARSQPSVQRLVDRCLAVRRLTAHLREGVRIDDLERAVDPERADQLTFEIRYADVDVVEDATEEVGLVLVAETAHGCPGRQPGYEATDRVCAADRRDLDAFGPEIASETTCEQLEDGPIARPFDGYE
jgi:hypothetical protein